MFKANTQNQSSNLSSANIYKKSIIENKEFIDEVLHSNKSVGSDKLLELLKNYCRVEGGGKRTITVGIVGYPNVGKSSIINSLKRGKVVGVSNTPGFTKGMTEISLDKDIKLLDCPGVVLSSKSNEAVLHNTIRTEDIKDPVGVVGMILKKVSKASIEEAYGIESNSWETIERFLYLIGDKLKKYKKGGVIDFDKVARLIVKDWNDGKLKYYTIPPNMNNDIMEVQMN
jgi:nuclear GTP-binding protein